MPISNCTSFFDILVKIWNLQSSAGSEFSKLDSHCFKKFLRRFQKWKQTLAISVPQTRRKTLQCVLPNTFRTMMDDSQALGDIQNNEALHRIAQILGPSGTAEAESEGPEVWSEDPVPGSVGACFKAAR